MKLIEFGRTAIHFLKPAARVSRTVGGTLRDFAAHPL
jgi:hypothetical protein